MMNLRLFGILASFFFLVGSGCVSSSHVIPETDRWQIDPSVTFQQILEDPMVHQGSLVVLRGEVLSARRLTEDTHLEILPLTLDDSEEPAFDRMASQGRFVAIETSSLDPATIPSNTRMTLAGKVTGVTQANLAEMDYRYPTVSIKHLYVWPEPGFDQSKSSNPHDGIFGGGRSGGRLGGG